MKFYSFLISTLLLSFGSGAQVMVLTQHNDLKRTGWNNNEQFLTQSTVKPDLFGKIFTRAVDDQIYAQPLVAGIDMNGGLYNVVIVATVNNSVYAFDADDVSASQPFWHVNLTHPGYRPPRNTDFEQDACRNFIGNIGIVGTPVIDMDTKTIYVVARSVSQDTDLNVDDLKEVVDRYKRVYRDHIGSDFPQDPMLQLEGAIKAVFQSWMGDRAVR